MSGLISRMSRGRDRGGTGRVELPSARWRRNGTGSVDEGSVPKLEHQERPESMVMMVLTGGVFVKVPAHLYGIEVPASRRRRIQQHVTGQFAEIRAEPAINWHAEAHLRPLQNRGWQLVTEAAPKQELQRLAPELETQGQRRCEL